MKKVYFYTDENGFCNGYSDTKQDNTTEIEVHEEHESLILFSLYRIVDGKLVKDISKALNKNKTRLIKQLNQECSERIMAGFEYEVEGEKYRFSFDANAQTNFLSTLMLMQMGALQEIEWTCYKGEEVHRVMLYLEDFLKISSYATKHKTDLIHRFRNELQPYIESCTTFEELKNVTWDTEIEKL